jgi:hypothetical protein
MKSFIATVTAILALATIASPAFAMPADNGPAPVAPASSRPPAPPARADGTAAIVYVLIGVGAALALSAGGYVGARVTTARLARPNPS